MSTTIYGTPYDDYLTGDAGDNWFMGSRGNDTLDGGAGDDTVDFTNISGSYLGAGYDSMWPSYIHVNLTTGRLDTLFMFTSGGILPLYCTTELRSIENVVGTLFDDVFTGNAQDNRLYGGSGNDRFYGSGGNDLLEGGSGMDIADYSALGTGFRIFANLRAGWIGKPYFFAQSLDTVVSIENVVGSNEGDAFIGNDADNCLYGGLGNDRFFGSGGNDLLDGGAGTDAADYSDSGLAGGIIADLSTGYVDKFLVAGGPSSSRDTLVGIEDVVGTAAADVLFGSAANNNLSGGGGNDRLHGSGGNDQLDGGAGIDTADYRFISIGGSVNADLGRRTAVKVFAGTNVGMAGTTGRYIRIYHNDSYVEGSQGHELGLTGMKVYDAWGQDVARGLHSSIGADGYANGLFNTNSSVVALTDAVVGGGWNGQAGDAGTVAYANTGAGGAKAYIQLDLGSAQAIDSISLWGDAGWTIDSKNLRMYVSNTPFSTSTNYTGLAADQNVKHFDLEGVETSATTTCIDTLAGIENLAGSAMNDTLTGDANANVLYGSGGNDRLDGGAGIDTVSYTSTPMAGGVDADLGRGTAIKGPAGTHVGVARTGRYIRIYHNDSYVEGPQGHELGLTGMKVYGALGQDVAFGLGSSIGADGGLVAGTAAYNNKWALTDATVGGGWNGKLDEAGNVAYVRGAKAYIELDLGSAQAIDSIRLWGDAGWAIDSKNLRIYVSNTAFSLSTNYTSLATDQNVARFDLAGVESPAMTSSTDTLVGIENLIGTAMKDVLTGDANDNVLSGGAGHDVLDGRAGIDTADYSASAMNGGINANLATGRVDERMAGTFVGIASTGRYIRIYHTDVHYGSDLGLTGMKVYAGGRDVAAGLRSSVGADGFVNGGGNPYNSNVALTDAAVGGGWNQQMGEAGNVAYVNAAGWGREKGYIELTLDSAQAIESISLWGDANCAGNSRDLRVYVSNTAFNASTAYASLAADQSVARFDLAELETSANATTTVWTDTLLGIENLVGTAMNDTLTGDVNANVLTGGAGNDLLAGSSGSDTYKFQRGDGVDTIVDMDYMAGYSPDLLQFQGDISSSQLWFRQAGYDLEVSVIGTADKTVVQDWYTGTASHVEQIKAGDGKLLLDTQVHNLVQAMAGFAPPAMGQTTLTSQQQTALAPVLAANWH